MRYLLITFLLCLLSIHIRVWASDPASEAAIHDKVPLETRTTGESNGAPTSADDDCEWISEYQLGQCLGEKAHRAELELNSTYIKIMASLDKGRQNVLRKEERAWIKWREVECTRQAKEVEDCVNGCGVPDTMYVVCMTDEAKSRVQHLKSKWHR